METIILDGKSLAKEIENKLILQLYVYNETKNVL